MAKYVCDVCGWVYDPETGDPDTGIAPAPRSKKSPMTGHAQPAASAKNISKKRNNFSSSACISGIYPYICNKL